MFDHLSSAVYNNFINTVVSFITIVVIYSIVNFMFIRKIDNQKKKKNARIRAFYVAALAFLFLMARVWVDGFMHLIAVLGLVSAGLVVTNKETIMNLVGWLIITWRGVFSEDDLIQIQNYKGYVTSIGVLYITLQEVSDSDFTRLTGKMIKVPNGLTANNSVINYTQTARLILSEIKFKVPASNFSKVKESAAQTVKKTVTDFYKGNKYYTQTAIVRSDKELRNKINLEPSFIVSDSIESDGSVACMINFYCLVEDKRILLNKIIPEIMQICAKKN